MTDTAEARTIAPDAESQASRVFLALGLAALMKEEPRDELTALFVRKLHKSVREIAAKTAPETLRRHDMMKSLDPETAARN